MVSCNSYLKCCTVGKETYQLKVLSTDYTNYAITYSCAKVLGIPLGKLLYMIVRNLDHKHLFSQYDNLENTNFHIIN